MMLSVAFLLVMPFVHHHHHAGAICVDADDYECVQHLCEDGHQEHDGQHSQSKGNTCVERSDYVVKRSVGYHATIAKMVSPTFVLTDMLSLSRLFASLPAEEPYVVRDEAPIKECFIHGQTLRAPPMFI